jgi:ubiquinone/menaquinone biosynthesis C-methylase UbiE
MKPSDRVTGLYTDMYAHGVERAWRDAGGADKGANIIRIWNRAGLPAKPRVVELGCGEGAIAEMLAKRGFFGQYDGYDLSDSGIQEARARDVPGATFHLGTGDKMPMGDDSADLVILSHVVEHLEHPRTLIYEARRIAKHIIVEVPTELTARLPRDFVWNELGHINHYTAKSIRQLIQTCDLEMLDQFTTNPPHALFGTPTRKQRLSWRIKDAALKIAPPVGRSLFVYHETLLARRPG